MNILGKEQPIVYQIDDVFDPRMANMVYNAQQNYINALREDYLQTDKDLKDLLKAYLNPIEETEEPKTSEEPEDSQEPKTSEEDNNSEDIETLSAFDTIVSMLPQLTNEERKALKKML